MNTERKRDEISIVLCGAAGQGVQTVEVLLTKTLKQSGFNVFATREYMSRVRGGVNSTTIRVASKPVRAFIERIDVLIPLCEKAVPIPGLVPWRGYRTFAIDDFTRIGRCGHLEG